MFLLGLKQRLQIVRSEKKVAINFDVFELTAINDKVKNLQQVSSTTSDLEDV